MGRLPGVDGKTKMSKSAGNAIPLSASPNEINSAVQTMFTDPDHLRVDDPGRVEGHVVFAYLDAFDENQEELEDLKAHYRRGGLGDTVLKRRLDTCLQALLAPIRERRVEFAKRPDFVMNIVRAGTEQSAAVTRETLDEVKAALGLFRFS
jgi:tryptophanyl-tRNA synthetase